MILGVDPGSRRVGVAVADLETRFARPVEVIDSQERDPIARINELVEELKITRIVVGRPLSLSGRAGPSVDLQADFVERLRSSVEVSVDEHDERLTTVIAERGLRAGGASARKRTSLRDAVAAQVMLQGYMDAKR